ncbi:MAG: peptidylprolyl isomerase [Chloroflexota bacterium]
MSDDLKVQDGQVVSMTYTLRVEGEILDSSEGQEPLQFIQGAGNIIPGLENEIYELGLGDSKKVVVQPEDGYGVLDPEAFIQVPRDQFPANIPLELGVEIQVTDENGTPMNACIDAIDDEHVTLDFNHPLAGKELHFDITIVALRDASDEENEHGHVHDGHNH